MENKNGNKLLLSLIGVATMIVAVVGATYAYFTATVTNNATALTVTTTQVSNLTMTSIEPTVTGPIYPGWVGYKGLTINASNGGTAKYDLYLDITGGTNIKADVGIAVCKKLAQSGTIAASSFGYKAATPAVSDNQYSMTGGVVSLPATGCTSVTTEVKLNTLSANYLISATSQSITSGSYDQYYVILKYENKTSAQVQGETFTITPRLVAKA